MTIERITTVIVVLSDVRCNQIICTPINFQYNITSGGRTTEITVYFLINRIIITDGMNSNNYLFIKIFFINFLEIIE